MNNLFPWIFLGCAVVLPQPTDTAPTDKNAKKYTPDYCGNFTGTITDDSNITSPGWPLADYPNSLDCIVNVLVPDHKLARLYFYDFYLEPSYECWLDRVEIWSRPSLGRPVLKNSFCGHRIPTIQLLDTDFEMHLITDRYDRFPGFHAILKYIDN